MKLRKNQIIRLILALCCLLVFFILLILNRQISGTLPAQYAAERWQNNISSAQMSIFFKQEAEFSTDSIQNLHESIDERLTAQALTPENAQARLWYDAYSSQAGQMEISGSRKGTAQALVTVIGGDFFLLHNSRLISGGYFHANDLMQDRVVIDTQLAWQLFGSSDVAGLELTIQNHRCQIAGVIQPEDDYASKTAYGEIPRIYLSYDFYQKNWEEISVACYEAVLPNPVRGFARSLLTEFLSEYEKNSIMLQNTGRYALSGRWNTLRNLRSLMVSETVLYPYWENAARIISFDSAVILLFQIIFMLYPVIYFIYLICRGYVFIRKYLRHKRLAEKKRYHSEIQQI